MKEETKFNTQTVKNLIWNEMNGFYEVESTKQQTLEFEKHLDSIPVQDYALVIDATKLKTFKPEILPILEYAYGFYRRFKIVIIIEPEFVSAGIQLKRIAKKVPDCNVQFMKTEEEAKILLRQEGWNV